MAFSNDKPIVETIVFDQNGTPLGLPNSSSIDLSTQSGFLLAGAYGDVSTEVRLLKVGPSGELFVTGSLDANVTLDNGSSALDPLFVSGSVFVTNPSLSVTFPSPQPITGSVTINSPQPLPVTGSVAIDASVTLGVTGSVGISTTVSTIEAAAPASAVTNVPVSLVSTTLLVANPARRGAYVYNTSNKHVLVKLGTVATTGSFTHKIFADAGWQVMDRYTGVVTAIWPSGSSGYAVVTELT